MEPGLLFPEETDRLHKLHGVQRTSYSWDMRLSPLANTTLQNATPS